mmetsp:Transcript_27753/g.38025  ORF Transcript_27753/g.38025 Transcript_27753/m.38025 type:complete len:97 (+) Transcript_27753:1-291(+)
MNHGLASDPPALPRKGSEVHLPPFVVQEEGSSHVLHAMASAATAFKQSEWVMADLDLLTGHHGLLEKLHTEEFTQTTTTTTTRTTTTTNSSISSSS